MRYIKLFFLVAIFFLVMLFFVQNQVSFADPVVLTFDLFFIPPVESIPLPVYSIMLICFSVGAFLVLLMLMWDRMAMTTQVATARRKAATLEKRANKLEAELAKTIEKNTAEMTAMIEKNSQEIAKLSADLAETESRLDASMRTP